MTDESERRRYPRVNVPIYCRPERLSKRLPALDVGMGGVRVLTDEKVEVGSRLVIELFIDAQTALKCRTVVAWRSELEPGAAAKFEVGLQFTELPEGAREQIAGVVNPDD